MTYRLIKPVNSSFIEGVGYDEEKRELYVVLLGRGVFTYHGVEQSRYAEFLEAESKGGYFRDHIQFGYAFDRPD